MARSPSLWTGPGQCPGPVSRMSAGTRGRPQGAPWVLTLRFVLTLVLLLCAGAPGSCKPQRAGLARWPRGIRRRVAPQGKGRTGSLPVPSFPSFHTMPRVSRLNTYVAICIAAKEEPDLVEWVEYHKRIGVSVVYVMDHRSNPPMLELLLDYVKTGFVVYNYVSHRPPVQRLIYELCLDMYGSRHRWMGFIDADEFVVIPSGKQIGEVLKQYEEFSGVVLNWNYMGSSGHIQRPKEGVLRSYENCVKTGNKHIKTFADPAKIKSIPNPHYAAYLQGFAVNTKRQKVAAAFNEPPLFDVMYLNHYFLKSLEDYKAKLKRGSGGFKAKTLGAWYGLNKLFNDSCGYLKMPGPDWQPPIVRPASDNSKNGTPCSVDSVTSNVSGEDEALQPLPADAPISSDAELLGPAPSPDEPEVFLGLEDMNNPEEHSRNAETGSGSLLQSSIPLSNNLVLLQGDNNADLFAISIGFSAAVLILWLGLRNCQWCHQRHEAVVDDPEDDEQVESI